MSRPMKDSGTKWLGQIPEHWEVKRLKHVAAIRVSNVDKHIVDGQPIVQLVNYTDVYYNDSITPNVQFMVSTAARDKLHKFRVLVGDSIITKDSETPDDIGVPAYVEDAEPDMVCGYHLAILRPVTGITFAKFVFYATKSSSSAKYWSSMASGLTRYGLKVDAIGACALPIPPLPEQRAIADYLDNETTRIDTLIEKKRRLINLLAERRQAIITEAVTKGLDRTVAMKDSEIEWLGEIPAHWEVKRLKHVATVNDDVLSEMTHPDYTFKYIDIGSVNSQGIISDCDFLEFSDAPSRARRKLREGDVLVSTVRTYLRAIAPVDSQRQHSIASTGFAVVRPRSIEASFIGYSLRSSYFIDSVVARSVGVSYPAINPTELQEIWVVCPPTIEQRAIADHLDTETRRIDTLVSKLERQIDLLTERRQAVITSAVTGKLDVSDRSFIKGKRRNL